MFLNLILKYVFWKQNSANILIKIILLKLAGTYGFYSKLKHDWLGLAQC